MGKLKITQIKSLIRSKENQIATIKALGLHKIGSVVEKEDDVTIRGMIKKVSHLVEVEEL